MALSYLAKEPGKVSEELREALAALEAEARRIGEDRRYTAEGRADIWSEVLNAARPKIQNLVDELVRTHEGLTKADDYVLAGVMPPLPTDPVMADEAAVARLISRGKPDAQALSTTIAEMQGSTALTLYVRELKARAWIDAETLDALLATAAPAYAEYRKVYGVPVAKAAALLAQNLARVPRVQTSPLGPLEVSLDYTLARAGEYTRTWFDLALAKLPEPFGIGIDGKIYTDDKAVPGPDGEYH